jgi:hypothetical protein
MAEAAYERLSAQDATFLDLEGPNLHQHIAAATIFQAGPLRRSDGGIEIDRIRTYISDRLHELPRYRQRLARIPLEGHPVWVDDPHFNIAYHVRHTGIPRPGDTRQLKRLCGRILSQQLDRGRPLWELWVVEGLDGGERFALVQKVHHCILTTEIGRRLGTTFDVLSWVPDALRAPASLWDQVREGAAAMGEALAAGLRSTSETPLNQPLGPHRRFDWLEMDLAEVKLVKDSLGGTVNDVVLATVAGALRRFLKLRRLEVDDLVIRANVPVSIRRRDQRGTLGNRIALFMPELPVAEAEPVERLARVREAMARLKESRQAVGADVLASVSEWTSATLLSLAVRVATRGRPYNLVVTNVPGPQLPLYLLGARMDTCYPVVNLLENQALGVALFSYDQRLYWGFTADWELLPDLHEFVRAIEISFQELRSAAQAASGARQTEPPGAQAPEAS